MLKMNLKKGKYIILISSSRGILKSSIEAYKTTCNQIYSNKTNQTVSSYKTIKMTRTFSFGIFICETFLTYKTFRKKVSIKQSLMGKK